MKLAGAGSVRYKGNGRVRAGRECMKGCPAMLRRRCAVRLAIRL